MATTTDPLETFRTEYQIALNTLRNELQTLRNEINKLRASQLLSPGRLRQQLPEHFRTWLPTVKAKTQSVWDYNTILDQLARVFENPNQQQEAEDALHNIRQADKESLPSYIAKFERLVYEAEAQSWPDSIKISTLRNGLNLSTRRALSTQLSIPASYNAFLQMIQRLSRRQVTFQNDHATPANHYTDEMEVGAVTAKAGALEIRAFARS